MTPKERAAMQQALEALREYRDTQMISAPRKAIEALREALAEQAEQEPVAWVTAKESFCGFPKLVFSETQKNGYKPLYAAPVRTKDLTEYELDELRFQNLNYLDYARAVIAADRAKNNLCDSTYVEEKNK